MRTAAAAHRLLLDMAVAAHIAVGNQAVVRIQEAEEGWVSAAVAVSVAAEG